MRCGTNEARGNPEKSKTKQRQANGSRGKQTEAEASKGEQTKADRTKA